MTISTIKSRHVTNKLSRWTDFKHAINAVMVTVLEMLRDTLF